MSSVNATIVGLYLWPNFTKAFIFFWQKVFSITYKSFPSVKEAQVKSHNAIQCCHSCKTFMKMIRYK